MESTWLKETRERLLEQALGAPGLDAGVIYKNCGLLIPRSYLPSKGGESSGVGA